MKKLVLGLIALGFSVGVNAACDTKSVRGNYTATTSEQNTCSVFSLIQLDGKGKVLAGFNQNCGGVLSGINETTGSYLVTKGGACGVTISAVDKNGANYLVNFYLDNALLKQGVITIINPNNNFLATQGVVLKTQ